MSIEAKQVYEWVKTGHWSLRQFKEWLAEAYGQEIEPRFGQGISDNPYCNDADSNEPDSKAMRWHNKLLSLEAEAKLKEKNT